MNGLTTPQANKLLTQYGQNILVERSKKPLIVKFFEQFANFLTYLLIGAAVLSFIIGEPVDGSLILAIVILNGLFGLFQEAKAEESIAALKKLSVGTSRVFRDGVEQEIASSLLVPGDICVVEEGVKCAADGVLVESRNVEVNESALTGESLPVVKKKGDTLYSGTIITKGRGILTVTQTGMQTKFGQIAHNLSSIEDGDTPLQKKLEELTRLIGIVGIVSAVVVFFISLMRGESYFPAFLLAISLAVAVVPEGLPAVMTITLALGVHEMSIKKAIVRKLSAIEALGSITLIATDKTGTLTMNKMKVKELYVDDTVSLPSGDPKKITIGEGSLARLLMNGVLCSTATLVAKHDHGGHDVLGDPTEGALLLYAEEQGISVAELRHQFPLVDEQPFDSVTKRMSVMIADQQTIYSKGAPESILAICTSVQKGTQHHPLTATERQKIETQMATWARKGLRVLAFSMRMHATDFHHVDQVFLGMVALHDAPRPEVQEAVKRAQTAGIRVVMITGDNEKTAEAVGVVAGIVKTGDDILTGDQLETYSDEQLMQLLPHTSIFARTSPFHKHRIVTLFQKLGEVVAVTGDGVNDAIALKQADVGVAMGLVGTDVARETADMVITDDNFATIVNAVEEGRNIIKNIKNAVKYLLACNISEAVVLIGGLALGWNHILFPLQLLYINLVTDGFPALALAFSPRDTNRMRTAPARQLQLLSTAEQGYIALVGIASSVITLFSYWYFMTIAEKGVAQAAVFSVLTLIQSFILIDLWLSHQPIRRNWKSLGAPAFLAAFLLPFVTQLMIVRVGPIAQVFGISTVNYAQFGVFILLSFCILFAIRGVKRILIV